MIAVLKITTGEEIIGDVIVDDRITVKNPCLLHMVPSRGNPEQASMALVPIALHLENSSVTIHPNHVIWMNNPVKELYNQYNSYFGSGIQLAGM